MKSLFKLLISISFIIFFVNCSGGRKAEITPPEPNPETGLAVCAVFLDKDGDSYGSGSEVETDENCQPVDANFPVSENAGDCNDDDSTINPSANEINADGIDNNCDGQTDEEVACNDENVETQGTQYFKDQDGDSLGNHDSHMKSCEHPGASWVLNDDDCDDSDVKVKGPKAWFEDADGDGFGNGTTKKIGCNQPEEFAQVSRYGHDCNDADASINPLSLGDYKYLSGDYNADGILDLTDGKDNNCDTIVDNIHVMDYRCNHFGMFNGPAGGTEEPTLANIKDFEGVTAIKRRDGSSRLVIDETKFYSRNNSDKFLRFKTFGCYEAEHSDGQRDVIPPEGRGENDNERDVIPPEGRGENDNERDVTPPEGRGWSMVPLFSGIKSLSWKNENQERELQSAAAGHYSESVAIINGSDSDDVRFSGLAYANMHSKANSDGVKYELTVVPFIYNTQYAHATLLSETIECDEQKDTADGNKDGACLVSEERANANTCVDVTSFRSEQHKSHVAILNGFHATYINTNTDLGMMYARLKTYEKNNKIYICPEVGLKARTAINNFETRVDIVFFQYNSDFIQVRNTNYKDESDKWNKANEIFEYQSTVDVSPITISNTNQITTVFEEIGWSPLLEKNDAFQIRKLSAYTTKNNESIDGTSKITTAIKGVAYKNSEDADKRTSPNMSDSLIIACKNETVCLVKESLTIKGTCEIGTCQKSF